MTFSKAPAGFKDVRGPLVEAVQTQLNKASFPVAIDGVWGDDTNTAICNWQTSRVMPPSGIIDDAAWAALMPSPPPSLSQRALQLTGTWEGTGYTLANGNFDGQGITWGVVGFTWGNGELQSILKEINAKYPAVFASAFGPLAGQMQNLLTLPLPAQMTWAQSISTSKGASIAAPWENAFSLLGQNPQVQEIENEHAQHYWDAGLALANRFGLASEPGLALCFDMAVQVNVTDAVMSQIQQQIAAVSGNENAIMRIIAYAAANSVNPKYHDDVLARKMVFVNGTGSVHGDNYDISCWGIG